MNCTGIKRRLQLYLDKQLSVEDTSIFENHISKCSTCRERFRTLKETVTLVENLEELELPSGFELPILRQVVSREPEPLPVSLKLYLRQPVWKKAISISFSFLIITAILSYLWRYLIPSHLLIKKGTHLLTETLHYLETLKLQLAELIKVGTLLFGKIDKLASVLSETARVFMENFNPNLLFGLLIIYILLSITLIKTLQENFNQVESKISNGHVH